MKVAFRAWPLALVLAFLIAGCSDGSAKEGSAGGAQASGTSGTPSGADLFRKVRCDSCHGAEGQGLPRMGPPLARIAENWTREELVAYFQDPAPFREKKPHLKALAAPFFGHMRPFPELELPHRETLADWLLARP